MLIGSGTLLIVLGVSLIGASGFTKINVPLFVIQFGSIIFGAISLYFGWDRTIAADPAYTMAKELPVMHWSTTRVAESFGWDYTVHPSCGDKLCTMHVVFAIIFPAATGIMEGANLSGDLANPQKSIWKGTLSAIGASFLSYVMVIFAFAGAMPRATMIGNDSALQAASFWPPAVLIGAMISTFSSSLGAVFGGSRLLQAVARDRLFPGLHHVGKGSGPHDEPRRAVVVTWLIAQVCLFIGDLNVVAPIISCFFLLSYGFTNLACFLLSVSSTPNFRPRFRYFSWHTALVGLLMSVGVMFYLNPLYAAVALAVMGALVIYLALVPNPSADDWGDVRQAIIFHQARFVALSLCSTL